MQPFVIRSEQDLWQAFNALDEGLPGVRFQGWPIMRIRSSIPIDGVKSASAVIKLQDAVHRQFSLLKYGTRNRRHLTTRDKELTRLRIVHLNGGCGIDIDFTNAMNACVSAVENWGEHRDYEEARQGSIFAAPQKEDNQKESWPRTTRVLISQFIAKTPKRHMKTLGLAAIFAVTVAWAGTIWIKEKSSETVKLAEAHYGYQVKMAELERTTVNAKTDMARPATPQEVKAVESDLNEETKRVLSLEELERPLLRFAMKEVEGTLPALMDMAPTLVAATYSVNGFELRGRTAAAIGKTMRKQQNAAKKHVGTTDGWEPQITTDGWEPQVKKTETISS